MSLRAPLLISLAATTTCLAGLSPATAATTVPTFAATNYPQLGNSHVAADFNGDGRADIAGQGPQSVAVLLNNGSGSLGPRTEYPVADWVQALDVGDFNNDGRLDIVATINNPQIGLALLLGNGDGTFRPAAHLPNTAGFDSPSVVATDLDDNGRLDIVIAHGYACYVAPCRTTDVMSVLMGNGDGTFQSSRQIRVGVGMNRIAVGDFNRNGIKDLVIAASSARLYRLVGVGDGSFAQLETLILAPDPSFVEVSDVDVSDFNRDGIQDVVVALSTNSSRIAVLIGNGDSTFRTPVILPDAGLNVPQTIAVADYNGDGFQDLAYGFANGNSGLFAIRNGNGDGSFQTQRMFEIPPPKTSVGTVGIVAAFLNGDVRPDIALAIGGAFPAHRILLNTTGAAPPPPPATLTAPALISPLQDATPVQPISFDWSDVSGAAAYRIEIDDSSSFSSPLIINQTVTASQFIAPGLVAARQHWWRVRGVTSAGTNGPFSVVRRFTPSATTTPPPTPPPPGEAATLTLSASGRGGERVTSSPAGINVASPGTGSAAFPTGTSITLSVTNGRDAIWSGACSSGGAKTRTCRFTLSGAASVSANIR